MRSRTGSEKSEAPYGLFGLLLRVVLLVMLLTIALNMLVERVWPPHMTERFLVMVAEPHTCQDLRARLERHNPDGVNFRIELPAFDRNGAQAADQCWLEIDGIAGRIDLGEQARPVYRAAEEMSDSIMSINQRIEPRFGEVQPLIVFLVSLLIATLLVIHHRNRHTVRRGRI